VEERLGIAGSGEIACGLAAVAAPHGEVVLWARSEVSGARARKRLRGAGGHDMAPDVRVTTHLDALADASFVVEAVIEDHEVKAGLYRELHDRLAADAVLATTRPRVFWGRGADDPVIPQRALLQTEHFLAGHSTPDVRTYPHLAHGISEREVGHLEVFLERVLASY